MDTGIMQQILNQITGYINGLDWSYIFTFIIIAYFLNQQKITGKLRKVTGICAKTRYRVAIIGVLYAILLYVIRGNDLTQIESLFTSFAFAMVFHKLVIDVVINFFAKRVLPDQAGKQVSQDQPDKQENGQFKT